MNELKLNDFVNDVIRDLGGAFGISLVRMGGHLGLYRALDEAGPLTSEDLARTTELNQRYVEEWLAYQAASGYLRYDRSAKTFALPAEHAAVLAREDSPYYMLNAFDAAAAYSGNYADVKRAFQSGGGVAWEDQTGCLACAIAGFFRPGYENNLVENWLPALDGVVERLESGAVVADVGCGHGLSTLIMAEAFPNSEFIGFDFHDASIAAASTHSAERGLANVRFEVATAKNYPGLNYDLVTSFDCLHDMGDPVGAAAHVQRSLKPGGTWMIVEPRAGDDLPDNLNPVGRLYYAASTMVCVPTSKAQEVGAALGAQAGEARLRQVALSGGFREVRRATETPFNIVLEAV